MYFQIWQQIMLGTKNYPFRIDIVMTKVLNDFDILHLRFQRPIHNIVHNVKSLKAH